MNRRDPLCYSRRLCISSENTDDSNAAAGLKEVMKGRRYLAQNVQAVSE